MFSLFRNAIFELISVQTGGCEDIFRLTTLRVVQIEMPESKNLLQQDDILFGFGMGTGNLFYVQEVVHGLVVRSAAEIEASPFHQQFGALRLRFEVAGQGFDPFSRVIHGIHTGGVRE